MAATGIDAVLEVPLDGTVEVAWDPHASDLSLALGLRTRRHPIDGSVDYRIREAPLADQCHLNGVARHDGALLVNLRPRTRVEPSSCTAREARPRAAWKGAGPAQGATG